MNVEIDRTEGDDIHLRVKAFDDAAFKAAVDHSDLRILLVDCAVHLDHEIAQVGIFLIFPCRIAAALYDGAAQETGKVFKLIGKEVALCKHAAADKGGCDELLFSRAHDS